MAILRPARPKALYQYPEHLREQVAAAPRAPGVYLFYGENEQWPLYIGKSVNIRARLLSHLRTEDEARLLQQTRRIDYRLTAGEIGALLLESQLIKTLQPLTNKRLRRAKRLCSLHLADNQLEWVDTTAVPSDGVLYGLFRSRRAGLAAIQALADEHRLCLSVLGLEKPHGQRCFRQQIGKCAGACCGLESPESHHQRTQQALAQWTVHGWPYTGPVALFEQFAELADYHVLDQWHYLGTYPTLAEAQQAKKRPPAGFDIDTYHILLRPLLIGPAQIIEL